MKALTRNTLLALPVALLLLSQHLTLFGWLGLLMVVGGVAAGYMLEGLKKELDPGRPELSG